MSYILGGGAAPSGLLWLPSRLTDPIDVVISGATSLASRLNFFKNLTINNGVTLTGIGGGCIIVVEETLTIGSGAILDFNGLGAKGGPADATSWAAGGGGFMGWNDTGSVTGARTRPFLGTLAATSIDELQHLFTWWMANGADRSNALSAGADGGSWPYMGSTGGRRQPAGMALWALALDFILKWGGNYDAAQGGAIGGGGGGRGGGGSGSGGTSNFDGGEYGAAARATTNIFQGGPGGSGIGGGGSGGGSNSVSGSSLVVGGDGGGMALIYSRRLANSGTIRANGTAGANANGTNGMGGGGGGGGMVMVAYEELGALGTLQAIGGAGGSGTGVGFPGGAGGSGIAEAFSIRSGF